MLLEPRGTLPGGQWGLTLIELMIVVVIVGVLSAIAYPNYRQHVLRSNRSEAHAALADAASRQERFASNNNVYTDDMTDLQYTADPWVTQRGIFSVDVAAATAGCPINTCFALVATAVAPQTDDAQCRTLTLTSNGTRSSTNSAGAANPAPPNDPCWP